VWTSGGHIVAVIGALRARVVEVEGTFESTTCIGYLGAREMTIGGGSGKISRGLSPPLNRRKRVEGMRTTFPLSRSTRTM
jgi:hypothetical protein